MHKACDAQPTAVQVVEPGDSLQAVPQQVPYSGHALQVVGQAHQKLEQANPQTYLGPGKLAELVQLAKAASAETIIFVRTAP